MKKTLRIISLAATGALFCNVSLASEESLNSGNNDFIQHCSACHGLDAKGFGPKTGSLKVRPSNLTLMSQNNGGHFPTKKLTDLIDGRPDKGLSRSHSNGDMPSWGYVFRNEKGHSLATNVTAEKQTKVRIHNLVEYIRSLQK